MINRFKWNKNNKLTFKNKEILSLVKDSDSLMWKIKWPDGYLSKNKFEYFEGLSRIKEVVNEMYPDSNNIFLNIGEYK